MATNLLNQCTTKGQSRRLLALGITNDTASLEYAYIQGLNKWEIFIKRDANKYYCDDTIPTLPCWTIYDMLNLIERSRGWAINLSGQVEIYSMYEPCKEVIGQKFTCKDDFSILRDNVFDALVWVLEEGYIF